MKQFVNCVFSFFWDTREKGDEKGRRGKCVFRPTNRCDWNQSSEDPINFCFVVSMLSSDKEVNEGRDEESGHGDDEEEIHLLCGHIWDTSTSTTCLVMKWIRSVRIFVSILSLMVRGVSHVTATSPWNFPGEQDLGCNMDHIYVWVNTCTCLPV